MSKLDRYQHSSTFKTVVSRQKIKETVAVTFGLIFLRKTMTFAVRIGSGFILTLALTQAKYLLVDVGKSNSGGMLTYE